LQKKEKKFVCLKILFVVNNYQKHNICVLGLETDILGEFRGKIEHS